MVSSRRGRQRFSLDTPTSPTMPTLEWTGVSSGLG